MRKVRIKLIAKVEICEIFVGWRNLKILGGKAVILNVAEQKVYDVHGENRLQYRPYSI